MSDEVAPITSGQMDAWLMSLPMPERREKLQRLARVLRVSKRTIENWRGGRSIPEKHFEGIHEVMRGQDKISIDFDAEVYRLLESKAKAHGFSNVSDYLSEFTKAFLAILFLGALAHQVCHPEEEQLVRRFGRRRDGNGEIAVMGEA